MTTICVGLCHVIIGMFKIICMADLSINYYNIQVLVIIKLHLIMFSKQKNKSYNYIDLDNTL